MVSYLQVLDDGDGFPYSHDAARDLYRFKVAGTPQTLGYVLPRVAERLAAMPGLDLDDAPGLTLTLTGGGNDDMDERSAILNNGLLQMRAEGTFAVLAGWRDETFPVLGPGRTVLFHLERCACPLFGVVTYGAHAIAYIPPTATSSSGSGHPRIWVSRRARSKQTFPGMLDSTAAGGIPSGSTPLAAVTRECAEEASLPVALTRELLRPAGLVTNFYVRDARSSGKGEVGLLQPEGNYVFDLPLPEGVACATNDGEADEFRLCEVGDVREALARGEFKPNSGLVMLDFLVRHGIVTSEDEDYVEIVSRLHRRLEFPLR